jgi:hypothetical protein
MSWCGGFKTVPSVRTRGRPGYLTRLCFLPRLHHRTSGAGKTTLGRRLATLLELPQIELDAVYWRSG